MQSNNPGNPIRLLKPTLLVFLFALLLLGFTSFEIPNQLVPINDLGAGEYLGFQGGLYPGGSNQVPAAHHAKGLELAGQVQPRNLEGVPDPTGKIVLLSIGMSNARYEFCGPDEIDGVTCLPESLIGQAGADPEVVSEGLAIVSGAISGQVSNNWVSPTNENYNQVAARLDDLGYSEKQVQVIWLKNANFRPSTSLPERNADAYLLQRNLGHALRAFKERYPNLQMVFLSSRIYAGYATRDLNPEPYAYESAFAVKWLIESQIDQMASGVPDIRSGDLNYDTTAPWIAWGPYLWADGLNPRSDGLTWAQEDFIRDGTHPSSSGIQKVGAALLDFFKSSPYTAPWFTGTAPPPGNLPPTAVIQASATAGPAPLGVQFSAANSGCISPARFPHLSPTWDIHGDPGGHR
jgi:hypothetical protein